MTTEQTKLIETDAFPFDFLSQLAKRESWRKEIYRPLYHLHKWWATRLGSIFRGILLGCVLPTKADLKEAFYKEHSNSEWTVLDPFMGSGTTIGEAHKLGFTVLGRDINPIAADAVRVVMGSLDSHLIQEEFRKLESTVGQQIHELYQTVDQNGLACEVLYYFWVKQVDCPSCVAPVDLFNSRIIGRNAFPKRRPEIRVVCPDCDELFTGSNRDPIVACTCCGCRFDPKQGNANGAKAICTKCDHCFTILDAVRSANGPPRHRLVGKLALLPNGKKRYLKATTSDYEAYAECQKRLAEELAEKKIQLPSLYLQDGHNTRQAMNYGYHSWRDFFNDRQLLALAWLQEAISHISDSSTRDVFLTLFSSTLEFNNMFASYKGEGTGAVRHMFSHHILKPERLPLEANVWGTPKSSGAFSGLYRTRLLKIIEYRQKPFEVPRPVCHSGHASTKAVVPCSKPFRGDVRTAWPPAYPLDSRSIYLSCGSSNDTGLAEKSIDLIVTDPPFFDNVHYSELADFFFAWQSLRPRGFLHGHATTRCDKEVQDRHPEEFALKLQAVFAECHRLLNEEGLLAFTYHHSRPEGWSALASAVCNAGFSFVNAHPVKAEMSVATPKAQAKEPIQLDVIMVCRKRALDRRLIQTGAAALAKAYDKVVAKATRLCSLEIDLSRNDRRVMLYSQFLAQLGPTDGATYVLEALSDQQSRLEAALDEPAFCAPIVPVRKESSNSCPEFIQGTLFD